jgi:membrane protease subunit HflK
MARPTIVIHGRRPDWQKLKPLRWLPLVILLLILLAGTWFTVPTDSVGVVLRFGAFHSTAEPGLHFKLPLGIDELITVPVKRQLKLEFGFHSPGATNPDQASGDRRIEELEKNMVTGDLNAALVEWVVQYRIGDARAYLFNVLEPGKTLHDLSEAAMREIVGDHTVDEVITIGRQEIEAVAMTRLRELSKLYELGVTIDQVQLMNVSPPQPVQASFNEVNKAEQERENLINLANGEYNKEVPRARGEAERKISEAEGYKQQRVNEAMGDAAAFEAVLAEYVKAPEATRTRLYFETMQEVLPQLAGTWIVDERVTHLLPMLPGLGERPATKEVAR